VASGILFYQRTTFQLYYHRFSNIDFFLYIIGTLFIDFHGNLYFLRQGHNSYATVPVQSRVILSNRIFLWVYRFSYTVFLSSLVEISTSATSLYTRLQDIISPTHLFNRFVDFLLSCGRSSFPQDPPLLQHPGPFLAVCMETLRHRSALVTLHHQYDSRPKFSDPPIFKTPFVQDPGDSILKAYFLSPFCAHFLKTLFLSPSPHFRAHFKKTPAFGPFFKKKPGFGPFSGKSPVLDHFSRKAPFRTRISA
jgi:hypothetical protein